MAKEDIYVQFGRRIREERAKAGLTREELAEAAGISSSFLAYIEGGRKKASLETVRRLAEGLGLGIGDVFQGAPAPVTYDQAVKKLAPLLRERSRDDRKLIYDVVRALSNALKKR